MKTLTLNISGMSCSHCAMSVRKALSSVSTVKEVTLGRAVVEYDENIVTPDALKKAVDEAGYAVMEAR